MLTLETLIRSISDGPPGPHQVCVHPDDWTELLSANSVGVGCPLRAPTPRRDDSDVVATWLPVRKRYGPVNRQAAWDRFLTQVYGEPVGLIFDVDVYLDSTLRPGDYIIHRTPKSEED